MSSDSYCGSCSRTPPIWSDAVAALEYRFPVDRLLCRFKYRNDLVCGQVLGEYLLRAVRQSVEPKATRRPWLGESSEASGTRGVVRP